ncbi:MAG: anti-sigma factor family protein [Gemmatimonadales bacterium]
MTRHIDRATCEDAFRKLDDYLDRRLTPLEMRLVEQHLETCEACTREFTFEASVLAAVRRKIERVEAPPDLLARISERIARAVKGDP